VTPVNGESWLQHLHRSFDETSMGKTGRLGPPLNLEIEYRPIRQSGLINKRYVTVQGADLYRLNCRSCHGEFGLGAPPEINSVIDPVRSSSPALVMDRMKKVGMDMKPPEAAQLAKQSQNALLSRLHNGGQDMPPFPHLNDEEIRALIAYLRELANVPGARSRQFTAQETPLRIGEHIVKSTCHVCHSSSGEDPDAQQLADGAIPPLSVLMSRVNEAQFIRKVTQGATIEMGTPALPCRGRMPVFYYLSKEEAAYAYLYLTGYSPDQEMTPTRVVAMASDDAKPSGTNSQKMMRAPFNDKGVALNPVRQTETPLMRPIAVALLAAVPVALLLVGMAGFTVRECMRLSLEHDRAAERKVHPQPTHAFAERRESQRIA